MFHSNVEDYNDDV